MENSNNNSNTHNDVRRFKIVVTDLWKDEVLMDVTTGAAIVTTTSPFDNLTNEDRDGCTLGAHYFNGKVQDVLRCVQSTIKGISELAAEHKELGRLLRLYMLAKQVESLTDEEEKEDEDSE